MNNNDTNNTPVPATTPAFPGALKGFAYVYCPHCMQNEGTPAPAFEDWNRWGDAKASARAHRLTCGTGARAVRPSRYGNDEYIPQEGEEPGFAMRYLLAVTPIV